MPLSQIQSFHPPWDSRSWVIFDRQALQANLGAILKEKETEGILDLRSPVLGPLAAVLEDDWRRLGLKGFLAPGELISHLPPSFCHGWSGLLSAPLPSSTLPAAAQAGLIPVISQVAEAIIWSNMAQQAGHALPLAVRVRGSDLLVDPGPTGLLSILEALPGLPMIRLDGFVAEGTFRHRHEADSFRRAISRLCQETAPLWLISPGGEIPSRMIHRQLIDDRFLTWAETADQTATFSIEAWGVPVGNDRESVQIAIDLGTSHGLPPDLRLPVLVEGFPGTLTQVEKYRSLIESRQRPEGKTPWRVTLLGASGINSIGPATWPEEPLRRFLADRLRHDPCFLGTDSGVFSLAECTDRVQPSNPSFAADRE